MADITTYYPGSAAQPVPNATDATNADQVDYTLHDGMAETETQGFKFWVGAEADAPALMARDEKTLYVFTS